MAKKKKRYICQDCGYKAIKWQGQCPDCNEWNTLVEEIIDPKVEKKEKKVKQIDIKKLSQIKASSETRIETGFGEFDRVLGGGIVSGSLILMGGDPGIGKSTLLLQAAYKVSQKQDKVLYVSGEESEKQIRLRADRLDVLDSELYVLAETDLPSIAKNSKKLQPDLLVIDSIQTMNNPDLDSSPGSVSQIRESTNCLIKLAKKQGIPIFIIGHVTKEGSIAGPKIMEHMVDTVLYLEGEKHYAYRILRAVKNRFGSINEIGIFEMKGHGLKEVLNPSQAFISERPDNASGSVVIPCMEGSRPILIELQALVSSANFGNPGRMMSGVDSRRVSLILAVLEKKLGFQIQSEDVYVNIAGGLEVKEPAVDLGLVTALVSSFQDVVIDKDFAVLGEIGLSGEVRAVNFIRQRVNEASKLGFNKFIIPQNNYDDLKNKSDQIFGVRNIEEALDLILEGEL